MFGISVGLLLLVSPQVDARPWETLNPLPTCNDLHGVWCAGPNDVYAFGEAETLLHFDGADWTRIPVPAHGTIYAMWGSASDDIWAGVSPAANKWLAPFEALGSTLLHFDGTNWSVLDFLPDVGIFDMWGSGPNDIFAVGGIWPYTPGTTVAYHYDGNTWTMLPEPSGLPGQFQGVSGNGPNDVYAAGASFYISSFVHWDGLAWTQIDTSGYEQIYSLWAVGPNNVYVGAYDRILHYDGSTVQEVLDLPDDIAYCYPWRIWGTGPNDVHVLAHAARPEDNHSYIFHFDGTDFSQTELPPAGRASVLGLHGTSPTDVYSAGREGLLHHYDGTTWTLLRSGPAHDLEACWVHGPNDLYAVGEHQHDSSDGVLCHCDGSTLTEFTLPNSGPLLDVWGTSPNAVYVVGHGGAWLFDGAIFQEIPTEDDDSFYTAWGTDANNVYLGGHRIAVAGSTAQPEGQVGYYEALIQHFDGADWSRTVLPNWHRVLDVWASGPNDVFAVTLGLVNPSSAQWRSGIVHYDGTDWTDMDIGELWGLEAIWGTGPNDVFAVGGDNGTHGGGSAILHYDGTAWSSMPIEAKTRFTGIAGTAPDNVFAVGRPTSSALRDAVYHYDGIAWRPTHYGAHPDLTDVTATSPNEVYLVGWHGTVLRGPRWSATACAVPSALGTVHVAYSGENDVTLTATTAGPGVEFLGWMGAPAGQEEDNPLALSLTKDLDLKAVFYPEDGVDPNSLQWRIPGGPWRSCGEGLVLPMIIGVFLALGLAGRRYGAKKRSA